MESGVQSQDQAGARRLLANVLNAAAEDKTAGGGRPTISLRALPAKGLSVGAFETLART
jgi:hypothetical protein